MATFTDTLQDAAQVGGAALLGASGPSGRGSATSLLNNRLRLAEAQRQSDLELQQLTEKKELDKHKRIIDLLTPALTDKPSFDRLSADVGENGMTGVDNVRNLLAASYTATGVPNAESVVQSLGPEQIEDRNPTKASLALGAAQGDEDQMAAFNMLDKNDQEAAKQPGALVRGTDLDPDAPEGLWLLNNPNTGSLTAVSRGSGAKIKFTQQEMDDGRVAVFKQEGDEQPAFVDFLSTNEGDLNTGVSGRAGAREERLNAGQFLRKEQLQNTITQGERTSERSLSTAFEKRAAPFREHKRQLDTLDQLLSGDVGALDETVIVNQLATLSDSNVRALANLNTFKNPGDIGTRLSGSISKFFAGTRTPAQLEEIRALSSELRSQVVDPAMEEISSAFRDVATRSKLNPDNVVIGGKKSLSDMTQEELEAEKQRLLEKQRLSNGNS